MIFQQYFEIKSTFYMKKEQDYIQDLAEIRSMMERSSKFLSLSGWAGVLAGIYALSGSYIAYNVYHFNPDEIAYTPAEASNLSMIVFLAIAVLMLAIGSAMVLSYRKANRRGEKIWNATSRRMMMNMTVPLATGGTFSLILLSKNFIGLIAPSTLLFYGLALYTASKFTYDEIKLLGLIQMGLGLLGSYFIEYSLFLWAIGFGVVHIIYGIYMHFRYER